MQDQVLDQHPMAMISQLQDIPGLFTAQVPPQTQTQTGEAKQKRRRRKNKNVQGAGKKRKLSSEQVEMLEVSFGHEHKLETERKDRLASELGLDPRQVAVWFQNRRARWKSKMLEEEFSNLRTLHDGVLADISRLEAEVLQLKHQLSQAQQEIQRLLLERSADNHSSYSPSSSMTMEAVDPQLLQEFGWGFESIFYGVNDPYISSMGWGLYNL